jgi:hypothetical protein
VPVFQDASGALPATRTHQRQRKIVQLQCSLCGDIFARHLVPRSARDFIVVVWRTVLNARIFNPLHAELRRRKARPHSRNGQDAIAIGTRCYNGRDQIGDYVIGRFNHRAFAVRLGPRLR